jgi:phage N-6-adenine-methyltransferase
MVAEPLHVGDTLTEQEQATLHHCEATIERGLHSFVTLGAALGRIRDERLYRASHSTFEAYCRERWDMTRHYANNLIAAASIMHDIESLETIVSKLPTTEAQVRPLRRLSPEERRAVWTHVVGSHDASAHPTQAQVEHAAQTLYPRVHPISSATTPPDGQPFDGAVPDIPDAPPPSAREPAPAPARQPTGSTGAAPASAPLCERDDQPAERSQGDDPLRAYDRDEWGTPASLIAQVRAFFGGTIACDPASNDAAQEIIQATTYYTKDSDGLAHNWHGTVWLNPPYSTPLIAQFVAHAIAQYRAGTATSLVILTNNATETDWFQALGRAACRICLLDTRVRFVHPTRPGLIPI